MIKVTRRISSDYYRYFHKISNKIFINRYLIVWPNVRMNVMYSTSFWEIKIIISGSEASRKFGKNLEF